MNTHPLRVLQLTDPHLGARANEALLGMNTEESLKDVLAEVRRSGVAYDVVIATGDISNDGSIASYHRFIARVQDYLPGVPLAWLAGNHDNPRNMINLPGEKPMMGSFMLGAWHFILLNSRIPFEEGGELSKYELTRLSELLQQHPNTPTVVLLHHQPVPIGSLWIDTYTVKNADDFFAVVDQHPNVKAVCWGHVHQAFHRKRGHLQLFATPSTCIQFTPDSQDFSVDDQMPGYRHLDLYANGDVFSHIGRTKERAYVIDYASTGY